MYIKKKAVIKMDWVGSYSEKDGAAIADKLV